MKTTRSQRATMRTVAERATQGEWFLDERGWVNAVPDERRPSEEVEVLLPGADDYPKFHNARHAVVSQPSAVVALLDDIDALRELLRETAELARSMIGHDHWDRTMQHGAGCEMCIRQREAMERIAAIAKEGDL